MIWQISYDRDQLPIVSTMWSRFKFSVLIVFIIFVIFLTANILVQENSILYTKRINKLLKDTIRWTNQKLRQFNSDGDNSIMEDYSDSIESQENNLVKLLVLAYPRYLFLFQMSLIAKINFLVQFNLYFLLLITELVVPSLEIFYRHIQILLIFMNLSLE